MGGGSIPQKMKFSIKYFFSNCDQIRRKLLKFILSFEIAEECVN